MIRHYETDSYLKECRAAVVSCEETQGGWLLELDESIFFPEEGGQNADTGTLKPEGSDREIKLLDGQIGKDGRVRYLTEEPIAAGTAVTCLLDFEKRFSRMQQHSGEHIVSGLVHKTYGYDNVGFHLSDDNLVTLDFNGLLSYEQAMELEMRANQAVWANLPVRVLFPSREELAGLDYRSKKEIDGQVRLVEVGEGKEQIDLCACCAPHVASTCEIGMIRILQLQNYKGGVRMGILCGKRALEHEQREWKRLTDIARSLSTGVGQIPESIEALQQEAVRAGGRISELQERLVLDAFRQIPEEQPALIFTEEDLSPVALKNCFNEMARKRQGYVGLFIGDNEKGYRYAVGSSSLDTRPLGLLMKEALQARGGGSREMVQGRTASSRKEIEDFWRQAAEGGRLARV